MPVRPAQPSETETLYGWIIEWSDWFKKEGIEQWNPPYPVARFVKEIEAGCVHCYEMDQETKAMVTIFRTTPDYYPLEIWRDEPALYLCRIVVRRNLSGLGVGNALLSEVEGRAREEGILRVRLDAVASNPFLVDYWTRSGFVQVAEAPIRGTPAIFMEKILAHQKTD